MRLEFAITSTRQISTDGSISINKIIVISWIDIFISITIFKNVIKAKSFEFFTNQRPHELTVVVALLQT